MNNRHARDNNHKEIVEGLRRCGFSVFDISQINGGAGDILVGKHWRTWLFEIKQEFKTTLTPDEKKFKENWKGQWAIITTLEEALQIMGTIDPKPKYPRTKKCHNSRTGQPCVYARIDYCQFCEYGDILKKSNNDVVKAKTNKSTKRKIVC